VAAGVGDKKLAANWVMGVLAGALNKAGLDISASPLGADALLGLLRRIEDETISGKIAKEVFEAMWAGRGRCRRRHRGSAASSRSRIRARSRR
jgi:aspartyl-tRNA(Asn)/glutamyl-tRNA(Gln) amidotransferase subunit B